MKAQWSNGLPPNTKPFVFSSTLIANIVLSTLIGGADLPKTIIGLIDSLDADLVSGLGSAVSISYANEMNHKAKIQKH